MIIHFWNERQSNLLNMVYLKGLYKVPSVRKYEHVRL